MDDGAGVFIDRLSPAFFSSDSNTVPEVLSHHWKNDCRLLETNIDKGFSLQRKIDFSVVMLLKMSARLIMTER